MSLQEKLSSYNSLKQAQKLCEKLKKNNIEAVIKHKEETDEYEVWVAESIIFNALGIAAVFDREEKNKKPEKEKKPDKDRATNFIKTIKASLIAVIVFTAGLTGYYLNRAVTSLDKVDINPTKSQVLQFNLSKLNLNIKKIKETKINYTSLLAQSKKIFSNKSSKWSLSSILFNWNISRAKKAYAKGNYEKAQLKLEKCLEKSPENKAIILLLSSTYFKLDKLAEAENLLLNSYEIDSGYDWKKWIALHLQEIYRYQKTYQKGIWELEKILQISPNDSEVLKKVAALYSLLSENTRAIKYIRKVLAVNENDIEAKLMLGELLFKEKEYDEALKILHDVERNSDSNEDIDNALMILSEIYCTKGNTEKAEAYLNSISDASKENRKYIFLLSVNDYLNGNYKKARAGFEKAVNEIEDFILPQLYLNLIKLNLNDDESGTYFIEKISPKCVTDHEKSLLHYNIAAIKIKNNNYSAGWRELTKSQKYDPFFFKKFYNDPSIKKLRTKKEFNILINNVLRNQN